VGRTTSHTVKEIPFFFSWGTVELNIALHFEEFPWLLLLANLCWLWLEELALSLSSRQWFVPGDFAPFSDKWLVSYRSFVWVTGSRGARNCKVSNRK